jgi:ATP-dependent Clp protease ATP-binding subunit ClpC
MFKLTPNAERLVDTALRDAATRLQPQAGYRNLLLGALDLGADGPLGAAYGRRRLLQELRAALETGLPQRRTAEPSTTATVSPHLERLLHRARPSVGDALDVRAVLAVACEEMPVPGVLHAHDVTLAQLLELAEEESVGAAVPAPSGTASDSKPAGGPILERFGRDLTALAREGKLAPAIGREREVELLRSALLRLYRNNPLLVGAPGTGKTAIVEHFARLIASGEAGPQFEGLRLIEVDLPGLVAGTRFRGDFEERIQALLREVKAAAGKVIPFIDEVHLLMGAGATEGGMDAANILKPALARGELRLVAATTPAEYRATIEKDGATARRFGVIHVDAPGLDDTIQILVGVRARITKHHGLHIEESHCALATRLAERYVRDREFPDKAIAVLDEACALRRAREKSAGRSEGQTLTDGDVLEAIERITGIQSVRLASDERERLARVEGELRRRVVGQPDAVDGLLRVLRRRAAGLAPADRPVGSFLFVGPSGVGKTELAAVLAEAYFGAAGSLHRFDMSEYADQSGSATLLGAPQGTIGSDRGGVLTNALRTDPYAVYLFDEIEKADRSTMNIFLQMLDAGRLTGRDGVTVDATHAVFVFTSNLGTREVLTEPGLDDARRSEVHLEAVRRHLPPELFRRFDAVVPFRVLDGNASRAVAKLQLEELQKRMQHAHGGALAFDDDVVEAIAVRGTSPLYGARNVRFAMAELVEEPLVRFILEMGASPARSPRALPRTVRGSLQDGRVVFRAEG